MVTKKGQKVAKKTPAKKTTSVVKQEPKKQKETKPVVSEKNRARRDRCVLFFSMAGWTGLKSQLCLLRVVF